MSRRQVFSGGAGNAIVADLDGAATGLPVLLLHGGGQTRHSWRKTALSLARAGHLAVSVDQRGHGDSDRASDGAYAVPDFADDVLAIAAALRALSGRKPAVVGASLGGLAALSAAGRGAAPFVALVLVDVTPRLDPAGVDAIQGFMRSHVREGFASIEEAAEAVAAYLPHRPRPRSLDGLKRNLRPRADGRYGWHWDPAFLDGPRPIGTDHDGVERDLLAAAAGLRLPTLLVRGAFSEIVSPELAEEFLRLAPHAVYADIANARHMVAGDSNDAFTGAILAFLDRLDRTA